MLDIEQPDTTSTAENHNGNLNQQVRLDADSKTCSKYDPSQRQLETTTLFDRLLHRSLATLGSPSVYWLPFYGEKWIWKVHPSEESNSQSRGQISPYFRGQLPLPVPV